MIENPAFARPQVSATFHARDLFAVAAARLACGARVAEAGRPAGRLVTLDVPTAEHRDDGTVLGVVVHIDRFGNATTNIARTMLAADRPIEVRVGDRLLSGRRTYADEAPGGPLALIGSTDHLELAIRGGSAAATLGLRIGDAVTVRPLPATPAEPGTTPERPAGADGQ